MCCETVTASLGLWWWTAAWLAHGARLRTIIGGTMCFKMVTEALRQSWIPATWCAHVANHTFVVPAPWAPLGHDARWLCMQSQMWPVNLQESQAMICPGTQGLHPAMSVYLIGSCMQGN